MAKRIAVLVILIIAGTVLSKIFGTTSLTIGPGELPILLLHTFVAGMSLALFSVCVLWFKQGKVSVYLLAHVPYLIWLSFIWTIAALLI